MNIFEIQNHEAAIFPMMPDDELQELVADIKENGLLHPIVIKGDVLIDGRNRLEACQIAGVEPETVELEEGIDPRDFIVSSNIYRQYWNKSQKAMAIAMMCPETEQGKRSTSVLKTEVSRHYISQARTILKHAPALAKSVQSGSATLSESYKTALQSKHAAESGGEAYDELRDKAPDLADLVTGDQMGLSEAISTYNEREQKARSNRTATIRAMKSALKLGELIAEGEKIKFDNSTNLRLDIEKSFGMSIDEFSEKVKLTEFKRPLIELLEKF